MIHKVYKITNNINEKYYIGVTKGTLEDRFKGHCTADSVIGKAIRKHGKDNFSINGIYTFKTKEESYNKEADIVNEDFLKRKDTYNTKLGGLGGWDFVNHHCLNNTNDNYLEASKASLSSRKESPDKFVENRKSTSKRMKQRHEDGLVKYDNFIGGKHSEETKKKIGEANSKHQSGTGNSQFGTIWIHNLEEKLSKKIKKEEFIAYEDLGWLKGRKMKF